MPIPTNCSLISSNFSTTLTTILSYSKLLIWSGKITLKSSIAVCAFSGFYQRYTRCYRLLLELHFCNYFLLHRWLFFPWRNPFLQIYIVWFHTDGYFFHTVILSVTAYLYTDLFHSYLNLHLIQMLLVTHQKFLVIEFFQNNFLVFFFLLV